MKYPLYERQDCHPHRGGAEPVIGAAVSATVAPYSADDPSFLLKTGEKNYCLSHFLGEKGKLIRYLDERGASEDQIAAIFKILGDIVRE